MDPVDRYCQRNFSVFVLRKGRDDKINCSFIAILRWGKFILAWRYFQYFLSRASSDTPCGNESSHIWTFILVLCSCYTGLFSLGLNISMAKRKETIIWSEISGALSKPKRLHLEKDIEGSCKCPVPECHHEGFTTQRGCRKHVKVKHQWFIYFNEKPNLENLPEKEELSTEVLDESRSDTSSLLTFPTSCEIGEQFNKWLTSCGGGSKSQRQAHQILSRVFKFFKFCCEDKEELSYEVVDFSFSSPTLLFRFVDAMEEEWKLQHAGRLGYLDSISEFIDFRKVRNPTEHVLRNLAITEVHLKKARRSISKMMRLQWVRDLDIETLEAKGHWATMAELVDVIAVNLPRYENILKFCRSNPETASPLDLSFATRFVAVYLQCIRESQGLQTDDLSVSES